jgi:high-affinity iron transporter
MYNALIVVYRESFEALLVVGILYSFLVKQNANQRAFRFVFFGVMIGLVISAALGYFINIAETEFQGFALEIFQLAMMSVAVVLMTHMCIWMRHHGRSIKQEIESQASHALTGINKFSLVTLTAIAIGREGSETVIFLYSIFSESQAKGEVFFFIMLAFIGLILGLVTWYAFQKGFKYFSQKTYFHVSSILLFITSGSLIIQITNKLHQLRWLPTLKQPIWDTSMILNESSGFGSLFSLITGYRSQPSLMVVVCYLSYWILAVTLYRRKNV